MWRIVAAENILEISCENQNENENENENENQNQNQNQNQSRENINISLLWAKNADILSRTIASPRYVIIRMGVYEIIQSLLHSSPH